jgi:EF-P beta-lysylation protein EpmB
VADAVTDLGELYRLLDLPEGPESQPQKEYDDFPLLVPRPYLARIPKGDPENPLLLQVLPRPVELAEQPGFSADPVGECQTNRSTGVLRKYPGRLLIVASRDCAVHCRFCFRRHFRRLPTAHAGGNWERVLAEIEADRSIREVILSGGDPLTLDDATLSDLLIRLEAIPHIQRVRCHTRIPVMIPQRVTKELTALLRPRRLTAIVVLHINHPAEIDQPAAAAFARLADAGIPLLSQSVLLRGVNDRVEVLAELLERLVNLRVMPYYLHQLDRVTGAAHFEVSEQVGVELVRQLRALLPGYAVPRCVRETIGEPSKRVLA